MKRDSVVMRAYRTLRHLPQYRDVFNRPEAVPSYVEDITLHEGEALIGVYENSPGRRDESIVVTDLGMWLYTGTNWKFIDYSKVQEVEHEPAEKKLANALVIRTTDRVIKLPVRGGRGNTRDVFTFMQFIDRVTGWYDRPENKVG